MLTCWRCNNSASGKDGVDTHASTAERLRKFGEGTLGKPVRARLSIGDLKVNVNVEAAPGKISITGLPSCNPPDATKDLKRALDELVGTGRSPLNLSFLDLGCSDSRQKVSWLRAGYLAAFASLGYRFIFRSLFDSIREQIRNPDRPLISFFHFVRKDTPVPSRFLMVVQTPEWVSGLLVQMGRHYVMLPILDGDHTFYSRLERGALESAKFQLTGKLFPWPKSPEHRFDEEQ